MRKTLCHEITDVELGTNQSVIKSSGGFVSGETHFGVIDSQTTRTTASRRSREDLLFIKGRLLSF